MPMILAQQLFAGIAADLAETIVDVSDVTIQVGVADEDRLIDRILLFNQFLVRLRQRRLGLLAVGDILKHAEHSGYAAVAGADGQRPEFKINDLAVVPD